MVTIIQSLARASQTNWFGFDEQQAIHWKWYNSQLTGNLDNAAYQDFKKSLTAIANESNQQLIDLLAQVKCT
ncbi:hypothetical protein ICE98_03899 [Lactococcus lactis]|nr:hypothetical protein [Lactococcus lactis]